MNWTGKLIGFVLGLLYGGLFTAVIGVIIGHVYDRFAGPVNRRRSRESQAHTQEIFFVTAFSVMGHLAKADGRVSESEIQAAERVMREMRLNAERRAEARKLFRRGKEPDFDLQQMLQEFDHACGRQLNLKMMFLQIQFSAAWADGELSQAEQRVLALIARTLKIPDQLYRQIEAMVGAFARRQHSGASAGSDRTTAPRAANELRESYTILGVSADASNDQIKRAYRRLMNQHHPDKLVAKGLPEDMMEVATRRAADIQNAYDAVKRERGLA